MGPRKPSKPRKQAKAIIQTVNGFLLLSCTSHAKPVAEGTLVSTRGASTGQPYRYRHLQGHWFSQPHSRAVTANTSPALVGVLGISVFKVTRRARNTSNTSGRRSFGHSESTTLAPFFPADEEHSRCTRLPEQLRRSIHRPQDPHWPSHRGCYTRTANKLTHTTLLANKGIATDVFGKGTNLQAAGSKA